MEREREREREGGEREREREGGGNEYQTNLLFAIRLYFLYSSSYTTSN